MAADKEFLTYNQQMKKLRDKKKIDCGNTKDKTTSPHTMIEQDKI